MQSEATSGRAEASESKVIVRPLRQDEIPALAAGIAEFTVAHYNNRWREQGLGYRQVLVADIGGEPVGTVSIGVTSREPDSLHLFALEVANAKRSLGIGTAIIEYVCDEARRRGLHRVHLEVRTDNPARRLYHRLGFRRVGGPFWNSWWLFNDDGTQDKKDELSYRMVKRLRPSSRST